MSSEWDIEHDWEISKLLVTRIGSYKVFMFMAGTHGLYIQSLRPANRFLRGPIGPKYYFNNTKDPHIVTVRSEYVDYVHDFLRRHPEFGAMKIFKHGITFKTLEEGSVKGFASNTVNNMMGLRPGATFRIKSDKKDLRDLFYRKALEHNAEHNFGCVFDYDEYDYVLEIRAYKKFKDKEHIGWAIFTVLYGDDMPNYYIPEV